MKLTATVLSLLFSASTTLAQEGTTPILFTNVNVFDGLNEDLIENANVVVTGNMITAVSTDALAVAGGTVIKGGGRTLMPGIIDSHIHLAIGNIGVADVTSELPGYMAIRWKASRSWAIPKT